MQNLCVYGSSNQSSNNKNAKTVSNEQTREMNKKNIIRKDVIATVISSTWRRLEIYTSNTKHFNQKMDLKTIYLVVTLNGSQKYMHNTRKTAKKLIFGIPRWKYFNNPRLFVRFWSAVHHFNSFDFACCIVLDQLSWISINWLFCGNREEFLAVAVMHHTHNHRAYTSSSSCKNII